MPMSMDAPPPQPPSGGGPGNPSYSALVPQEQPQVGQGAGMGQTGNAAIQLSMEIDASIKLIAQMVPALGPWAEQVTAQLRTQLGEALQGGQLSTSPEPRDGSAFPTGEGNL